jgi:thiol-disulfide isomerase/thioredoxin
MKILISLLIGFTLSGYATAEFEKWTNKEGKSVELELVKVTQVDGQAQGDFKMRDGRAATLKAADLIAEDAKRLDEWQPKGAAVPVAASVYDEILKGNLLMLKGKRLASLKEFVKPTKYYMFYYTASWCGPCHKYTPSLVDFYNKNKNANFEIVLITSDDGASDMEQYAAEMKMPWPQLKLGKAAGFKKKFPHDVDGIPSVIICDLEGKIISRTNSIPQLEKLAN